MEKIHGGDIYSYDRNILDFSANINPLGIPLEVKIAIEKSSKCSDIYPDTEYKRLRQSVAKVEEVPFEYIICGNGAAELIFNIVLALKPRRAVLISPSFAEYEKAADTIGCEKIFYTLTEEKGFAIDEDYLKLITRDTDMIFICQPNNPTGLLTDMTIMEKIIERCVETDTMAVIDECFLSFVRNCENYSTKRMLKSGNIFILKAFTKLFAIPGVRLGYGICGNKEILEKIYAIRQPWNVSHTAEEAGIAACSIYKDVEARTVGFIEREREYISDRLKCLGIKCFPASANYILFKAECGLKEKMANKGILLRGCGNYRGLDENFYRVAVKKHEENEEMLKALEECLWQKH
ncbi:threonine-phosphate decarboxylase [Clostridiales bacterium]|nr:threonine-phosphate decarboxylase [Clostridiales bacterium]